MQAPSWRLFEEAVSDFLRALGGGATVTHDKRTPDAETGAPRQRDIWIETTVCGNILVKILVSCKHYNRKLNQQDIDHFNGEFSSSGANKAVLYSSSGFNDLAIEKARKIGISCLSLFHEDKHGNIPESLVFFDSYCCYPRFFVRVLWVEGELTAWEDVLDEPEAALSNESVANWIARKAREIQNLALERCAQAPSTVEDWRYQCTWQCDRIQSHRVRFEFGVSWDFYKATLEGHLVSGSYSFTDERFAASVSTPAIDTLGGEPGPGWERVAERPLRSGNQIALMMDLPDIESLLNRLRGQPLATA